MIGGAAGVDSARPKARQFASEKARELLCRNGLGDLDAIFFRAASVQPRHAGRGVWSTTLSDEAGVRHRVFAKLQWRRPALLPRWSDLLSGQAFSSYPIREWNGLWRLAAAGLCVAEPMAVFGAARWAARSAVVVRAVPAERSLADLLRSGDWQALGDDARQRLMDEIVVTMERIRAAGLRWRSAAAKHVFPARLLDRSWRLWLIDCEGVERRGSRAAAAKDRRRFLESLAQCGGERSLSETLRVRWAL